MARWERAGEKKQKLVRSNSEVPSNAFEESGPKVATEAEKKKKAKKKAKEKKRAE
jgi:hypothetical protein